MKAILAMQRCDTNTLKWCSARRCHQQKHTETLAGVLATRFVSIIFWHGLVELANLIITFFEGCWSMCQAQIR